LFAVDDVALEETQAVRPQHAIGTLTRDAADRQPQKTALERASRDASFSREVVD
jgi:hypothetical protein